MRKHFLILMLLTLLPFTAWADVEISEVTITFPSAVTAAYTGTNVLPAVADVVVNAKKDGVAAGNLTYDTEYTAAWSAKAGGTGNITTYTAGVYVLTLTAKTGYVFADGATTTKEFTITNAAQEVNWSNNGTDFDYGTVTPTLPTMTVTAGNTAGDVTYTYKKEGATGDFAAAPTTWTAGKWFVKASVPAVANYDAYVSDGTQYFTVNKVIAVIGTAPTTVASPLTYSGEFKALLATEGSSNDGTLQYTIVTKVNNAYEAPTIDGSTWYAYSTTSNSLKKSAAGSYKAYYYIQGDANHTNSAVAEIGEVVINKSAINVTTPAELNANVVWDGNAKQVIKTAAVATGQGNVTVSYAVTTNDVAPDANAGDTWYTNISDNALKVTAANTYYAYYKAVSDDNNSEVIDPTPIGSFEVTKKAASITTLPKAKTLTYNAGNQVLVNEGVADGGSMQFSFTGSDNDADWMAASALTKKDAGTYKVYYRVKGDGNHSDYQPMTGTAPDQVKASINVTINRKTLRVKADAFAASKTIFGVFKQTETVTFTYGEFAGDETSTVLTSAPTAAIKASVKADANCTTINGVKYIKAGNYAGALQLTGGSAANYELILLDNDLNISPASVKVDVKAAPADATFGTQDAAKYEWTIAYKDRDTYVQAYAQTGFEDDGTTPKYSTTAINANDYPAYFALSGEGTTAKPYAFSPALKMTRADHSTAKGEYPVALSGATGVSGQTTLTFTNVGEKKFKIVAAALTIKAKSRFKTYGTADPKDENGNWVYEVTNTTTGNDYNDLNDDQKAAIVAGLSRTEGETVGDYKISFSDALKNNNLFKNNYTVTWTDGWLSIEKADLKITAKKQSLYKGNTAAKLGKTKDVNYTVTGLVTNADLEIADVATVDLEFGNATNGGTVVPVSDEEATKGQLTTAGEYDEGIVVVLKNIDDLEDNYNITLVNGKLEVIDTDAQLVLSFTDDNTEALAATSNKTNMTVKFGARTLAAKTWGVLVLPFATTVREISNAFGYAVVDVLDQSKGDGTNVYFKLHMGEIAANTPIMVKSDEEIDFTDDDVKFTGKKIITTGITEEGKTAAVKDAGNTEFIGFYKGQEFTGAKQLWLSGDGVWGYNKNGKTIPVGPTRAYLQLPESNTTGAHIFIEEADGTVTAISTINAEGEAVPAEGWYTLNGIRLEGVPTEKGIYVRNGKKVVIK
jgi:hypothetical protein